MTTEQQQLRAELDRIASLAAEVEKFRIKLERAQDELARATYETQQKWGK